MKLAKLDVFYICLLFVCSFIFISDIFFHGGVPQTFDAIAHTTTIAQFYLALSSGDFPVVWLGGFANYGLPIGIIAHQVTSYLGALILFITHDPISAFNIVAFIGILLSNIFFYLFLRLYFTANVAFVSTFFFNFSSYRILNFYVRGALPEIFSNLFLPLILLGIYYTVKKRSMPAIMLLVLTFLGLALNHPMMLLIYSFIYIPYLLFLLFFDPEHKTLSLHTKVISTSIIGIAAGIGVGMASFYLLPLLFEIKYFYYGLQATHLTPNSFLGLASYFDSSWYRFSPHEIYTRGQSVIVGIMSSLVIIAGAVYFLFQILTKKVTKLTPLLGFTVLISLIIIFFTSSFSNILYTHSTLLSNIQFPWRMLSAFIFLPPLIIGILLTRWNNKLLFLFVILLVCLMSFPQLFGKDYEAVHQNSYFFTIHNPHSVMMNTIWTGKTEEYPIHHTKPAIIDGKGSVISQNVSNSKRQYVVTAETPLRMVDYTFYFPGWKVFVDNKEVPIEFQDPKYRGVITYSVPSGKHTIFLQLTETKIRFFANILSLVFIGVALFFVLLIRKYKVFLLRVVD